VGVGPDIITPERLAARDFAALEADLRRALAVAREARRAP
jgi:hypothetical protein